MSACQLIQHMPMYRHAITGSQRQSHPVGPAVVLLPSDHVCVCVTSIPLRSADATCCSLRSQRAAKTRIQANRSRQGGHQQASLPRARRSASRRRLSADRVTLGPGSSAIAATSSLGRASICRHCLSGMRHSPAALSLWACQLTLVRAASIETHACTQVVSVFH